PRQLASVLLPLPPFIVAMVMIALVTWRLLLKALRDESVAADTIDFPALWGAGTAPIGGRMAHARPVRTHIRAWFRRVPLPFARPPATPMPHTLNAGPRLVGWRLGRCIGRRANDEKWEDHP